MSKFKTLQGLKLKQGDAIHITGGCTVTRKWECRTVRVLKWMLPIRSQYRRVCNWVYSSK